MYNDINREPTEELCTLRVGERGRVRRIGISGAFRRRLLDLGLVEGAMVECVGKSPMGDPSAYLIRGAVIALRSGDCRLISVVRPGDGR